MGRHTGPKARINRRLGAMIFESSGAVRAAERRDYPPGMSQRRRKPSNYAIALLEKQKIKYYYGLRERQLRRYFEAAKGMQGNTGEQLLMLCERRLDNVIRRAGFADTRPQARQGASHGHFQVNGRTVTVPSIRINAGDVISVRNRPNLKTLYGSLLDSGSTNDADWIDVDTDNLSATVTALPTAEDVSLPVDVGKVVVFLSR
ncbi:MAG TPA: 30S ribosomal protein S4 [Planctomycetaceae bacterium]|jgi:small subunit ribosomal protein S4|nr:30S ribosomal protein S4 [Planctomycetaceae bacterium]MCH2590084.1 30S ribosomal protein S4 [Planctomycetales bacterium]HAA63035.1 30S ribosomal protein S4 [Planctomycetaceae bacterium]|tara:strand:- start:1785 stop:2393 length:609 start_codon:yes stop_codon:yes gene_type:complete